MQERLPHSVALANDFWPPLPPSCLPKANSPEVRVGCQAAFGCRRWRFVQTITFVDGRPRPGKRIKGTGTSAAGMSKDAAQASERARTGNRVTTTKVIKKKFRHCPDLERVLLAEPGRSLIMFGK